MHLTYAYLFEIYGSSFEGNIIVLAKDINTAYDKLKSDFKCNVSSTIKISDDHVTSISEARELAKKRKLI